MNEVEKRISAIIANDRNLDLAVLVTLLEWAPGEWSMTASDVGRNSITDGLIASANSIIKYEQPKSGEIFKILLSAIVNKKEKIDKQSWLEMFETSSSGEMLKDPDLDSLLRFVLPKSEIERNEWISAAAESWANVHELDRDGIAAKFLLDLNVNPSQVVKTRFNNIDSPEAMSLQFLLPFKLIKKLNLMQSWTLEETANYCRRLKFKECKASEANNLIVKSSTEDELSAIRIFLLKKAEKEQDIAAFQNIAWLVVELSSDSKSCIEWMVDIERHAPLLLNDAKGKNSSGFVGKDGESFWLHTLKWHPEFAISRAKGFFDFANGPDNNGNDEDVYAAAGILASRSNAPNGDIWGCVCEAWLEDLNVQGLEDETLSDIKKKTKDGSPGKTFNNTILKKIYSNQMNSLLLKELQNRSADGQFFRGFTNHDSPYAESVYWRGVDRLDLGSFDDNKDAIVDMILETRVNNNKEKVDVARGEFLAKKWHETLPKAVDVFTGMAGLYKSNEYQMNFNAAFTGELGFTNDHKPIIEVMGKITELSKRLNSWEWLDEKDLAVSSDEKDNVIKKMLSNKHYAEWVCGVSIKNIFTTPWVDDALVEECKKRILKALASGVSWEEWDKMINTGCVDMKHKQTLKSRPLQKQLLDFWQTEARIAWERSSLNKLTPLKDLAPSSSPLKNHAL